MAGMQLIRFNHVMRDAVQSLIGTNCSADEILEAYKHAHEIGTDTIQTGGGTFFDIFAKKGRKEWEEVKKILTHFKERGVRQTALIRGDCLFSYRPQSFDTIKAMIREYAEMGMNDFQNFHGLNDVRALEGVAEAIRQVREETGLDIVARGTICIEDNPNITLESCLETAEALIRSGHQGFYLKSASGVVKPEFVHELVTELCKRYPDQKLDIHIHSTYGQAPACYMAAVRAAVANNHAIGIDVQHPAMAGNAAHPSILKMHSLIKHDPDPAVRENLPDLNFDAIDADRKSLAELRFRYRDFEISYNPELLPAMRAARAPGGATSTLKTIPGLVDTITGLMQTKARKELEALAEKENDRTILERPIKKPTWDDVQAAIYGMQARILPALGEPTQVTPYALNTTTQAAISLVQELQGKDKFAALTPETMEYLAGYFGRVPQSVDPVLQKRALDHFKLEKPIEYVPSIHRNNNALDSAKEKLKKAGIAEPTQRQAISTVVLKDGLQHVVNCANNTNKPVDRPSLPDYALAPAPNAKAAGTGVRHRTSRDTVQALGGIAALEQMAQRALFLKQLDDNLNIFPPGTEHKKDEWIAKLQNTLSDSIHNIRMRLQEAGFPGFTERDPSPMKREWRMHEVQGILHDIFNRRAPQLFEHIMDAITEPGQSRDLYRSPNAEYSTLSHEGT